MKRALPFLGIALGAVLVVYALFFAEDDEAQVRARFRELAANVAIQSGESSLTRTARMRKAFADIFTKDVTVAIPELETSGGGRAALVELAVAAPQEFAAIALDLDDLRVRLDDAKEHALAVGEAHLSGTRREGARVEDDRTVSIRLDRLEKAWRIVDVTVSRSKAAIAPKEGVAPLKLPAARE